MDESSAGREFTGKSQTRMMIDETFETWPLTFGAIIKGKKESGEKMKYGSQSQVK